MLQFPRCRELAVLLLTSVSHYSSSALPFRGVHTFQPAVSPRLLSHALRSTNSLSQHGRGHRTAWLGAHGNGLIYFFPLQHLRNFSPFSTPIFGALVHTSLPLIWSISVTYGRSAHLHSLSPQNHLVLTNYGILSF